MIDGLADHMAQAGSDGDEVVLGLSESVAELVVAVGEFGIGGVEFSVGLR
jgi:hypothetical protein